MGKSPIHGYKREGTPGEEASARGAGFTLIELIIAMVVGLVVLAAMFAIYSVQNRELRNEDSVVEMRQNGRAAMAMMIREITMAGYDITGTANAGITAASANSMSFTSDLNGNGATTDADETVTYTLCTINGVQSLGRAADGGSVQSVADNIQSLNFSYFDDHGVELSRPVAAPSQIHHILISLTATTDRVNPDTGRRGTYTLTTQVAPRNLVRVTALTSVSTTTYVPTSVTTVETTVAPTTSGPSTVVSTEETSVPTTIPAEGPVYNGITQTPGGHEVEKNTPVRVCVNISAFLGLSLARLYTDQGDTILMLTLGGGNYCASIPKHNNRTVHY
ncbi:MAG: prepilin-type N-terminal cleavage/methylation domain-containing protein, partial [Smithellaceae bacterium]|nr:prepilin-type N-terminal cleavage/methylation domain-containing protein [Smithellaceae bacterium]